MGHYTVLFMPDDASRVRRLRVPALGLRRALLASLAGAVTMAAVGADWVRLRREAFDVDQLRAESALQQEQLRVYSEQLRVYAARVHDIESQLDGLAEFDRKVRVIANLPTGRSRARGETAPASTAVGGGADDPSQATPPIGVPTGAHVRQDEPARPQAKRELEPGTNPIDPVSLAPPDAAGWARMAARTERLARRATQQQGSLERLIELLRGKAEQLAATPSIWPARGLLTSRYGYRISPFTGLRDFHGGLDVAAEPGTQIVAPARGRVVRAGAQGALGNVVVIDHGFGVRTTFGHAQKLFVSEGEAVERGQQIASVGNTGRSTGPHLHYALERNGRLTNPLDYIVE